MTTPRPVRVMRVVTNLQVSGPSLHAVLLAAHLDPAGYESTLVCGPSASGDDMAYIAEAYGVVPVIIPDLRQSLNPLAAWRAYRHLLRLMRGAQPDVVHTHTTTAGFLGRLAARRARVPVVVHTLHWHPFHGYYTALQTRLFAALERLGARLTDRVIALSTGLQHELVGQYHITRASRIMVLPLGFDLRVFAETPRGGGRCRAACGIPPEAPLVGIVGRLMPVKRHDLFLEMAARLRSTHPTAHFLIAGDGNERANIEAAIAEQGLGDSVHLLGWARDVAAVYSDLDVLVNCSLNEGTPVPVIEALAAGCPVVATDVGGTPDLLDHGVFGRLVPPDDAEALAAAVAATIASPPDLTEARAAMLRRYGIDRLVADLDSLYRGLLLRRKAARQAGS
jgi:glycosyltransferase involved in cell wall biosynthesis